uniref:ATP-dependent DNA helicase n=1 Tax=Tanacetum cinerariifolium TaxID=118510 RepID=A0A6L2KZN8_TANCI|nr:ATP-dependent DNA helicase PIF1-like [Tanacetum cinerariifolium]
MEVVQEYPADKWTAAARTGLVGPAGVPGGMAGMSNGLGLCRRQLGQQWSYMRACTMKHGEQKPCVESQPCFIHRHGSKQCCDFGDFEELPFGVEDVDVTIAVGEEELPSNVLEVLVSSLKDDSLSRSMLRVVSNEGRVSRCQIMSTRVAKRESSPLTVYMTRWWLGWSITSSHGNQLGGDEELAERRRERRGLELSDTQRMTICLTYIEHMLLCNNKCLKSIPSMPYYQEYTIEDYNILIYDELTYNKDKLREQHQRLYGSLTSEQKGIYATVMEVVDKDKGGMLFVYGYGALLLEGRRTAHSRFAIPLMLSKIQRILPVIPNGSRQDVVHATINDSSLWEHFTVMKLTENMRLGTGATECERKEIQDFADWILDIGNRNIDGKNDGESTIKFPNKMLITESDDHVDMINERMHSLIPGDQKIYESSDSVSVADADYTKFNLDLYTTDFLNTIRMSGVPHHMVTLKIGAPVMCMRNIDQMVGLCNETRLQIYGWLLI